MEQSNKWSSAATNGLILSLVTIIYSLASSVIGPKGVFSILLWIIKFGACIYLLYYFMKQYSEKLDTISYGESFHYGFLICAFSAIVCVCFNFISITFLFPEQIELVIEQIRQTAAARGFDSDQEATIDKWMDKLPQIILFFGLIYYTLVGAAIAAIIANYTKKTDIFAQGE